MYGNNLIYMYLKYLKYSFHLRHKVHTNRYMYDRESLACACLPRGAEVKSQGQSQSQINSNTSAE